MRTFFFITLPLLTPVIFFNLIMQMVQAFQEFNGPYIITQGGPLKATYLLPLYIYDEAFKKFNMGYASAIAWVLFTIITVLTLVCLLVLEKVGLLRWRQEELTQMTEYCNLQRHAGRPQGKAPPDIDGGPVYAAVCGRLRHALSADLAGRRELQDEFRDLFWCRFHAGRRRRLDGYIKRLADLDALYLRPVLLEFLPDHPAEGHRNGDLLHDGGLCRSRASIFR